MNDDARWRSCLCGLASGDAPDAPTDATAAEQAARLLGEAPADDWRLRDLAALVHLSTSQLSRAFNQRFGMPPMRYLAHVRAHRLAQLLVETELPIEVAMNRVGWHSRGHAARQFSAIVGISPSAYRREPAEDAPLPCPCRGCRSDRPG